MIKGDSHAIEPTRNCANMASGHELKPLIMHLEVKLIVNHVMAHMFVKSGRIAKPTGEPRSWRAHPRELTASEVSFR